MLKRIRIVFTMTVAIILASLTISAAPSRAADKTLTMGLASADSREALLKAWQPIIDDLSDALGMPVEAVAMEDYASVIWYLATNKAQVAWMGNKAAIEAVDRANSEIIVQSITQYGAGYYAHLITQKDAPYADERDVLNRAGQIEFGIGDPNSTSGFAVPSYYLFASKGIDPKKVFKRLTHNNHENNFLSVAKGKLDVATSNSSALARYKARFPEEHRKIKVIWTSPLIPSDPIVVRTDLAPEIKQKVTTFFINYARPVDGKSEAGLARETSLLKTRKWVGFQRSDNSQLEPIRRLELYKKRLKIERNPHLNEAARKEQMSEIDAALKQLDRQP